MEKTKIGEYYHIPYQGLDISEAERLSRSGAFYKFMEQRRTVRDISDSKVSREVIEKIIQTASTSPSGAHKQPWTFCAVSNTELKIKIRAAAEQEEYESYHGRMSDRWLNDLQPMATDWNKPFLENAPWLIVVFKRVYEKDQEEKQNNYYVNESVGIACGFLISAIHHAGLVTVTHTPSPMNFLTKILDRPENERPYLLLPVGLPIENALVPDLKRKNLDEIAKFY
ncbi:MAG: iodotyrosine deiodinase [Cyclobacteriaceae bacterium]|jgi:iodotyrosine deiodinase